MKRAPKSLWILIALLSFAGILKATLPQVVIGTWTSAATLTQPRSSASAVVLADGRILFVGGDGASGPLQSAEFFATDGTVSAAAAMNVARSRHFAVALGDGRVLVGGGTSAGGGTTNSAELYDPSADSWTQTNPMSEARANATAALLNNGRVLIAGGDNSGTPSNTIEIFDPASGNFSFAGTLSSPRTKHAMAVLQDGRVLIVGGFDGNNPLASSDIFDPSSGNVSAGPSLVTARSGHSATTLLDGRVVVIGGSAGSGADLASAEIYDPASGGFNSAGAALATARQGHQAFLLPNNNNVLIVGGTSGGAAVAASELFTPQVLASGVWTSSFAATGANVTARSAAVGSAMQQDGLLLAAGGNDASGNALASTELYAFPTVKTDQADYAPGTTVTITGSGFKPGETVTLTLVESPLIDTHPQLTAVADANGNISNNQFSPDVHDVDVRFYLTAVGSQSGLQAQNTFTDASNITSATVTIDESTCTTPTSAFTRGQTICANVNVTGITGSGAGSFFIVWFNPSNTAVQTTTKSVPASVPAGFTDTLSTNGSSPTGAWKVSVCKNSTCNGGGNDVADASFTLASTATRYLVTSSSNTPAAGSAVTITAQLSDAGGNPVPTSGKVITWSSTNGGSFGSPTSTTNSSGQATVQFTTSTVAGTVHTVTATDNTSLTGTSANITTQSGTASKLAFGQQPTDTAAGSAISPAVTVKIEDANGNVITSNNSTVSITISIPGTFSGTSTTSVAAVSGGVATFSNLVPTKVGTGFTLSATDGVLTGATSNPFNVTAGALDHFKVEQSGGGAIGTQTAGTSFNLRITAQDINNNTVTSFTSTVTLTSSGTLTGSPLTSGTFTAGVLDPQGATITSTGAAVTITATGSGKTGISNTFAVNAGALDHFKVEQSGGGAIGTQTAGTPFNLRITAQDINNNTVTSFTSTVTLISSGTLTGSPLTSGTFTAGVLDPQGVTITSVGASVTITATGSAKTGTSNSFAVTAPDLTATKTNSVFGTTGLGNSWTWSIQVSNIGTSAATFGANNQVILHDDLPSANVSYSTPTVGNLTGITNSNQIGCTITANVLNCVQSGNGNFVTIAANGSFTVSFTATPSAAGTFANPSSGGTCKVDPNNDVGESNTANNSCADTVTVSAANTSTTITSTIPATSGLVGQPVSVNFQVKNTSGTGVAPTGTVTVSDGTTADNCTGVLTAGALGVSTGSCNLTPSTTGAKTLTASYPASANFNASASAGTPYTVNSRTTSTTVSCSPNPDNLSTATTCTATVTDTDTGTKTTPGGTVNFSSNGTGNFSNSASCILSSGSCSVTYTPTVFGTGTHRVTGTYAGDTTHAGSNGFFDLTVQNPATTTAVATSGSPSNYGTAVTFTATVTSQGGTPTGSVTFYDGGTDCATHGSALGSSVALNGSGVASLATAALSATTHTIVVCYTPTGIFQSSSGTVIQMVNAATLTITANDQTKGYGQTLSLGTTAFTTSGLVGSDSVTNVTLTSAGTPATAAAGSYAIVPSAAIGTGLGNYTIKYVNGTLSVTAAMLTITANDAPKTFGQTITFAGTEFMVGGTLYNGDSVASVTLTSAGAASGATVGSYPIIPSAAMGTGLGNYAIAYANGALTVIQATPSLNWNTPADITYGTALGNAQLNATSNTGGFFTYTPAAGKVLNVGNAQTLSVVFTPSDLVDFSTASATVQINVLKSTPLIVWKDPADITYGTVLGKTQLNAIALPPSSALTGWWKGDGNASDSAGGNDGTAVGVTFPNGQVNQAFSFAGSGDQVTIPYSSGYDLNAPGFTAEFWVSGSHNANGAETILDKSYDPNANTGWTFQVDSNSGHAEFDIGNGTSTDKVTSTVDTLDGTFHYITGVWDGTKMELFVDGISQGTKLVSTPANNSNGLTIGFSSITGQPFTGLVDEVQIFRQAPPAGTYTYNPLAGTVLNTGSNQTLSVTFDPTDTADLNSVNLSVNINVNKANQTITFAPLANKTYGDPDFAVSATSDSGLAVSFAAAGNCTVSGSTVHITGAGSCTITASQAGDSNYNPATDVPQSFTIAKANQTITVTTHAPASAVYNTSFNVVATASSGLTVAYSSSGVCSNAGATFTMTSGTGTCAVQYDQAGDANYNAATQVTENVTAQKANQTITVSMHAPASAVYNTSFNVVATASSNLAVAYSASGVCTNVGATFTMTSGTGTCTVRYDQAGDANYNAATQVTEYVTAQKANQTITVSTHAPALAVYNTSFNVVATASSNLAVAYSASGVCTNVGATFTMTSGTGTCTVRYDQAGDANYNAATQVTEYVTAQKANQTITVSMHAPASAVYNTSFNVVATASSNLAVAYSASGVCTNVGATFTMTSGTGTCTVRYDQAGDANYNAATQVTEYVTAQKANQTITVSMHAPASAVYNTSFNVVATASSNLAVAYSASGVCTNVGATFTMTSGTGTCTVRYDQAGDANYNAATQVTEYVTAQKANQTITVSTHAPALAVYNTSFNVVATANSNLVVTYSSYGVCTNSGATFTMTSGTGTCTVKYDQAGDANYNPATQVTENVTAQKANQTITVSTHAPASAVYNTSFNVVATASSNLAVTYSSYGVCTNAGATFTMTSGTGTCTVKYDQAGDANYNAATQVTESVTAQKANQTISVTTHAPASAVYNTTFNVVATASSNLVVTYSSYGVCTNSGATFTMTSGTGTCTVKYDQAGDANYNAATQVTESVTAQKANQTISVTTHAPASAIYNTSFNVVATASSGLTVAYSSSGVCSNAGATFTMTSGTGTCTAQYDQAGDANYNPATQLTESVTVQKAEQTITFGALANKTYGDPDFAVSATSDSGLGVSFAVGASDNCTISGAMVHVTGAGSCTVTVSQTGNNNYNAAPTVPHTFSIARANVTVMFSNTGPFTYNALQQAPTYVVNGVVNEVLTPSATASYSGAQFDSTAYSNANAPTHAGNYVQTVTFSGNNNYNPLNPSATQAFVINKAYQTITFGVLGSKTYGDPDSVVSATSTSGLAVSFAVGATDNCTIVGATVHITGAGNCTVTASQAGNNDYYAATPVARMFAIAKATLTVTGVDKTKLLNAANPPFTVTYSGFVNGEGPAVLGGSLTCTTTATTTSSVGSYAITCSGQTSPNYMINYAPGTLKILYVSGGMCAGDVGHAIRQPINPDGTSVFKQKSTVPAKFAVCDANAISIGTPGVVSSFRLVQTVSGTVVAAIDEAVDSTTPDTTFRWDPTAQQWIFNMNTKSLAANVTYFYVITLNDGSTIPFNFGLK